MQSQRIRLRAVSGELEGKSWESDLLLRIGRLANLEIVLDGFQANARPRVVVGLEQAFKGQAVTAADKYRGDGDKISSAHRHQLIAAACCNQQAILGNRYADQGAHRARESTFHRSVGQVP